MKVTESNWSSVEPDEGHIAERYLLISWCCAALFGCLTGNTIILLATFLCKTIRLDKTSLVLIKNIAVSDILVGLVVVHPTLASLVHGTWPYGTLLCYVFGHLYGPMFVPAVLLVFGFHLNKLYSVIYPLSIVGRTCRSGHVISAVVWSFSAIILISQIALDYKSVVYSGSVFGCRYSFTDAIWERLLPSLAVVFIGIPNILVVGTTAALAFLVRRTEGRLNRQGIMVAINVGGLYLASNLPPLIYLIIFRNFRHLMSSDVEFFLNHNIRRAIYFLVFTNCFCNFFVYFKSVRSFNAFVKRGLLSLSHRRAPIVPAETFRLRALNRF